MNKKLEDIFRTYIYPDTSGWRTHPAFDKVNRNEFLRSQRVVGDILDYMDSNPECTRLKLAETLGITLPYLNNILQGRANFTTKNIEDLDKYLTI